MGKSFLGLMTALGVAFGSAVCTFALLLFGGAKLFSNRAGLHRFLFLVPLVALIIACAVWAIVFLKIRPKQNS